MQDGAVTQFRACAITYSAPSSRNSFPLMSRYSKVRFRSSMRPICTPLATPRLLNDMSNDCNDGFRVIADAIMAMPASLILYTVKPAQAAQRELFCASTRPTKTGESVCVSECVCVRV